MIEFTTITIICILLLLYFRPGKTPPLDRPLVIDRLGQYHAMLAPQLNLAQPLIEAIAKQLGTEQNTGQNSSTQYFEVHDKQVTAHGHASYLLAITRRNGLLYFQATAPSLMMNGLVEFVDAALAQIPATGSHSTSLDERIVAAALAVARQRQTTIKQLRE